VQAHLSPTVESLKESRQRSYSTMTGHTPAILPLWNRTMPSVLGEPLSIEGSPNFTIVSRLAEVSTPNAGDGALAVRAFP
jgi:hypothetical protein